MLACPRARWAIQVGHMSLGAGRIVYQSITRIDQAIASGEFATNTAYLSAIDAAIDAGNAIHVMGMLSSGGVHSHEAHLYAALQLAAERGATELYLHAFLDGRDTPPRSAEPSLARAEATFSALGVGRIASLHGRYWAMDRDNVGIALRKATPLLTQGTAEHHADSAAEALAALILEGKMTNFWRRLASATLHSSGTAMS